MKTHWIGVTSLATLLVGATLASVSGPGEASARAAAPDAGAARQAAALNAAITGASSAPDRSVSHAVAPVAPGLFDDAQIDYAYHATGRRRTALDVSNLVATGDERAYLRETFALLDQAVTARVHAQWRPGDGQSPASSQYDALLGALRAATPTRRLVGFHTHAVEALSQQREAVTAPVATDAAMRAQPAAQAASDKLRAAARELHNVFPAATAQNQAAFSDTLSALDLL